MGGFCDVLYRRNHHGSWEQYYARNTILQAQQKYRNRHRHRRRQIKSSQKNIMATILIQKEEKIRFSKSKYP